MPRPTGLPGVVRLDANTDTDHASCVETRRSTTCGTFQFDSCPFFAFARRQAVLSTSSGEAELYGGSSTLMEGSDIRALLLWYGYSAQYSLYTDSFAAKSMMCREGLGRVKHLDIRALWVQQERFRGNLSVRKVVGLKNVADLGTKAHPRARFVLLRDVIGYRDLDALSHQLAIKDAS